MRICLSSSRTVRSYTSSCNVSTRGVKILKDWSLNTFQEQAFKPAVPSLLPTRAPDSDRTVSKWFVRAKDNLGYELSQDYWKPHEKIQVPLEFISYNDDGTVSFQRSYLRLGLFLEAIKSETSTSSVKLYLAQCQLTELPKAVQEDIETPHLVLDAGRGDVYDSNIWMGRPPTYTPLHRDPNPNFFLQIAGQKKIRLYPPDVGASVFDLVQRQLGVQGRSAVFRGEEMMKGDERRILEDVVWNDEAGHHQKFCQQAVVQGGNALFIPKGWWHSIKGFSHGINASINWWFR
ncbi:MAG: hypothetical protein Q9227_009498 [Pyrenula ochraceoflavens]